MDFLTSIIALYVIVDPLGNIPIYLSLTKDMDRRAARRILVVSVAVATAVLLIFALTGLWVLSYFDVGLSDFLVASGIILLAFSIQDFLKPLEEASAVEKLTPERAVVPLAVPFLAGPAAITYVITLSKEIGILYTIIVIFIVAMLTFITLLASRLLLKILGRLGVLVIEKIILLLAAAVGIALIREGLAGWGLIKG
ncbi:MAG: MarC family protein [Thermoproteus sp. AZ2]|jgi:multiple antibiotic resistance protein|uniref:MarC family protein n=1 Tax=Thermoproteus sp. AZ2 TaxID=1609232 RepID=A0ACC6UZ72_9CREN